VRDEQRDAGNGPDLAVDVADREDREGEGSGEEPTASWLGRSRSSDHTIRGENWHIASCTATVVSGRLDVA
jgi:hypothetical protein